MTNSGRKASPVPLLESLLSPSTEAGANALLGMSGAGRPKDGEEEEEGREEEEEEEEEDREEEEGGPPKQKQRRRQTPTLNKYILYVMYTACKCFLCLLPVLKGLIVVRTH